MISLELKRLTHLLNDIQDPNLEKPEMATDFDVVLLMCDLISLIRCQIAKTIRLEVQASQPFIVHLPENTLRQAVLNLVLNAAQALEQKAGGRICIYVDKVELGLSIQVLDNGEGFSSELLKKGISPLQTSAETGSGLGLAMTEKFVHYLGGTIKISNQPPYGASVSILLPDECVISSIEPDNSYYELKNS